MKICIMQKVATFYEVCEHILAKNDLKELFKVDFDIKTVSEGIFLLQLQDIQAPAHYPHVLSVLGKAANPYFEQTRESLPWYRLVNELQMFLHQHRIQNQPIQVTSTNQLMNQPLLTLLVQWFATLTKPHQVASLVGQSHWRTLVK